ncbi:MAG: hypothetical protein WAP52_00595 [Candidatus Sungiibacteriota bacterium]
MPTYITQQLEVLREKIPAVMGGVLVGAEARRQDTTNGVPIYRDAADNQKAAQNAASLGVSSTMQDSGLSTYSYYSRLKKNVKRPTRNIHEAVEVGGVAPPDSWMTNPSPHCATPTAFQFYHDPQPSPNRIN